MNNIVAKNIKDLFQIFFFAENITMDNKYIFVSYEGRFDANIFFIEREKKKKRIFNMISVLNLRVIFLYKYKSCIDGKCRE